MISIGTDIVKVSRISKIIDDKGDKFLNKIFADEEIFYCNQIPIQKYIFNDKHAKEAWLKSLTFLMN